MLSRLVHLELTRGVIYFKHMGGYLISFKVKTIVYTYQFSKKNQEYKVEKLECKRLEVMQPRIENKSELPVGE